MHNFSNNTASVLAKPTGACRRGGGRQGLVGVAEADRGPWWASAAADRPVEVTGAPFGLVEADRLIGLAEAD